MVICLVTNRISGGQERRTELESSHALHRFLADYRDLVSWLSDIRALIAADDLAKDVPGAEALLERHQEHKVPALSSGGTFAGHADMTDYSVHEAVPSPLWRYKTRAS